MTLVGTFVIRLFAEPTSATLAWIDRLLAQYGAAIEGRPSGLLLAVRAPLDRETEVLAVVVRNQPGVRSCIPAPRREAR